MANRSASQSETADTIDQIAEDLRPLAVPLADLAPDPKNARKHDDASVTAIAASLRRYGQRKPIVFNVTSGQIEAGHGTVAAAKRLKWTHVAAVKVRDDPATQTGFAIADNRSGELSTWDFGLLLEGAGGIRDRDDDLLAALLLDDLLADKPSGSLLRVSLDVPPAMTWVLVGVPTTRFPEISEAIEGLAKHPDVLLEITANDLKKD